MLPGEPIHYGSTEYNPKLIYKIENDWIKPKGGLWTSPVNSDHGWKDWCRNEDFMDCIIENSFSLRLHDDAKL